jgi:hypothetical protein
MRRTLLTLLFSFGIGVVAVACPLAEAAPMPKSMRTPRAVHPTIEKLIKLVPPPAHPFNVPTDADWAAAEKELGTPLPEDYKDLVNTYGEGCFSDLYICLFSPRHSLDNLHLLANQRRYRQGQHDAVGTPAEPYNVPIKPDDGGDTIEHLHIPAPATGGEYKIVVKLKDPAKTTGSRRITSPAYGLAWWVQKS